MKANILMLGLCLAPLLLAGNVDAGDWLGESYCNGDPWLCGAQRWLDSGIGSTVRIGSAVPAYYYTFNAIANQNSLTSGLLGPYSYSFATTAPITYIPEPTLSRTENCCTSYSQGFGDILPAAGYRYEAYLLIARKDWVVSSIDAKQVARNFLNNRGVSPASIAAVKLMVDGKIGAYAYGYDPTMGLNQYVAVWKIDGRGVGFIWSFNQGLFRQMCSTMAVR